MGFQAFDASVTVGGIVRSGTNQVTYATSSDERLKEGIAESNRGLDALLAIKVSDYMMGETASQGFAGAGCRQGLPGGGTRRRR